eukprot:Gb_16750 [translate_table: standard]
MKLPTSTHVVDRSPQCLSQWWAPPCDTRNHPYHLHPKPPQNRPTVKSNEGLLQRVVALPARELPPQLTHHQTPRAPDQSCSRRRRGQRNHLTHQGPSCGYGNPRGHLNKCHVGNIPLAVGPKHLVSLQVLMIGLLLELLSPEAIRSGD